jgi:hypothetical protein
MKVLVPPMEVSRLLLLGLVAAGAILSVVSTGTLSAFAGGFAVGSGAAFVFSKLKRPAPAGEPGAPRPDEENT